MIKRKTTIWVMKKKRARMRMEKIKWARKARKYKRSAQRVTAFSKKRRKLAFFRR